MARRISSRLLMTQMCAAARVSVLQQRELIRRAIAYSLPPRLVLRFLFQIPLVRGAYRRKPARSTASAQVRTSTCFRIFSDNQLIEPNSN